MHRAPPSAQLGMPAGASPGAGKRAASQRPLAALPQKRSCAAPRIQAGRRTLSLRTKMRPAYTWDCMYRSHADQHHSHHHDSDHRDQKSSSKKAERGLLAVPAGKPCCGAHLSSQPTTSRVAQAIVEDCIIGIVRCFRSILWYSAIICNSADACTHLNPRMPTQPPSGPCTSGLYNCCKASQSRS